MPFCARLLHQHLTGKYDYERPANMDQEIFDIVIKATVLDGNIRPSLEEMEHDLRLVWNSKVWSPLFHAAHNLLSSSKETLKHDAAFQAASLTD